MGENEVDTMLRDNFLIDAELNFCSTTSSLTKPFTASEFCSSVGVGRLTRVCIASKLALIVSRHQPLFRRNSSVFIAGVRNPNPTWDWRFWPSPGS
jgi:hypothetical protein